MVNMVFHHFVGDGLSRSELVQQWLVRTLLSSQVLNEKRESSVEWELKHSSGVIQIARILADKRDLDIEMAEVAACLHDIYVITNGSYKDHARLGASIARKILEQMGSFKKNEMDIIAEAVGNHSDKHIYSDKPYVELVKDADALDCFLYGDHIYDDKPDETKRHYLKRIISIRRELGLKDKSVHVKEFRRLEGSL